ncbi:MAG TPA: hypothetical protein VGG72_33335 [Bryobacteraceae bacterium]
MWAVTLLADCADSCGMEPVLDRASPLTSVLTPGERLIWVGHPTRAGRTLPAPRYLAMIVVAFGYLLERLVSSCIGSPLPILARLELFALGIIFVSPVFWLRHLDRLVEDTTYVLTNKRLLMAVGPDRAQIREVALAALAPVNIRWVHRNGRVLVFDRRGPGSSRAIWTFLDSGKADKWFTPWIVDNQEFVRQLIETARKDYWSEPISSNSRKE